MARAGWVRRLRARLRWSVRTRVLTALVALAALAIVVTGTTAFVLERNRVDENIEDSLDRTRSEFETFATEGVDPDTGMPFTDVGRLLRVGLGRIVPAPNEGMLGFVDGRLAYQADAAYPVQLQQDPELIEAVTALAADGLTQRVIISTADTSYRVQLVTVRLEATDGTVQEGTLVLAHDRAAEHEELGRTYATYGLVGMGALVIIAVIGWLIVRDLLRPVRLLRDASSEIAESTDLSRRIPVVGNDDLAVLTSTVNHMLERLDNAFSSQRELLDDVGHELRTPLTVVRGHLELMDPADPEDARSSRDIALDELDRMNMLVEDLVTLAKSNRPDFVSPRTTDVAMLTDEVLTKAQHLGQRAWHLDGLAEVEIDLDPRRVTQAWLQLASNAVKFSQPGSVVALGSASTAEAVRLWVRDEGIGISAQDQGRVFQRFERAETGVEGSGLGLTIVRSIAQAHGGDVELASVLGRGTTVTIVLPATADAADALEELQEQARIDPAERGE